MIYPEPYSIYLRGTIGFRVSGLGSQRPLGREPRVPGRQDLGCCPQCTAFPSAKVSHTLTSLQAVYIRDYIWDYYGAYKGGY